MLDVQQFWRKVVLTFWDVQLKTKYFLKNKDIPFEEVNIEEDADQMQFILSEGHRTMPQIYHNGKLFVEGGYQGLRELSAEEIKEKINGIDTDSLGTI